MRELVLAVAIAITLAPAVARAHPLAFGVLVVREHDDGIVDVSFRFSGTEARTTGAEPMLPASCRELGVAIESELPEGGLVRRSRALCAHGLAGERIAVRGMEGTGVQIAVTIERPSGGRVRALLDDGTREVAITEDGSVLGAYVALGVEHILGGIDHLMFVLALLLLAGGRARAPGALLAGRALGAITAFTVGHSVTLALAALGAITLPSAPVEACIAASIVVLALELARPESAMLPSGRPDAPTTRVPWAMAGAFGLLHGLGFAGALTAVGLPRDALVTALLGFNLGVELGQLAFVALCVALLLGARAARVPLGRGRAGIVLALGATASYFLIDRLTMLGGGS